MKKAGKILIASAVAAAGAYLTYDLIQIWRGMDKYQDDANKEAEKRIKSKRKAKEDTVKQTLDRNIVRFEQAMKDYGAVVRSDLDKSNVEKYDLRPIYEFKGNYYRVGSLVFDDEKDTPYIVINAIDNQRFAEIGVMEEIEAYPYDMPEERIREVVAEFLEADL